MRQAERRRIDACRREANKAIVNAEGSRVVEGFWGGSGAPESVMADVQTPPKLFLISGRLGGF